jgi:hypothetical protein
MSSKQSVMALATKGIKMNVNEALKSTYAYQNLEVNSDFKCLVHEEIDYDKDYDCIHATIYLKIKYTDDTTVDKFKARKSMWMW